MGSNPMFPIEMKYNSYAYVINHYNLTASKKYSTCKILLTRKSLMFIKTLYNLGAINSYIILKNNTPYNSYIRFSINFYKNEPFYKNIKLITKPSQNYSITKNTLSLLHKSLGLSVILLNTSKGIIDSKTALKYGISGSVLCVLN